jgi:hypothetical protein
MMLSNFSEGGARNKMATSKYRVYYDIEDGQAVAWGNYPTREKANRAARWLRENKATGIRVLAFKQRRKK